MKQIEEYILSGLMYGGLAAMRNHAVGLSEEDFTGERRTVFQRMRKLQVDGLEFDLPLLAEELKGVVPADYLASLCELEIAAGVPRHIRALRDEQFRVRALQTLSKARRVPVSELASEMQDQVWQYQKGLPRDWYLSEALDRTLAEIEKRIVGDIEFPTGLRDLDEMTGGLHRGEVTIMAGRPSQGKSALAVNICNHLLDQGRRVLFVDLETSDVKILERFICLRSGVPVYRMNKGTVTDDDLVRIVKARKEIQDLPLVINDNFGVKVADILSQGRNMKADLLVVDYLQLVQDGYRESQSRSEQMGNVCRSVKMISRELRIPVLALSQLNRASESRAGNEPNLSDLRDSGEIEQSADNVLMLFWKWVYTNEDKYENTLLVKKQRHGPVGRIPLYWNDELMEFGDLQNTPE